MAAETRALLVLFLLHATFYMGRGELRMNYYSKSCPRAEEIVKEVAGKLYQEHGNTAVSWVRNLFHDCMVSSCDASLLLEATGVMASEKASPRSFGMRNFKYVKVIKDALEAQCPATVSCADVIALSAREGILLLRGPYVAVKTGRLDSRESRAGAVEQSIPNHNDSISYVLSRFQSVGIDAEGTVALLGAHSVGRVHCLNLVGRLYPTLDPTLDPSYGEYLRGRCPSPTPDPEAVEYGRNDRVTPMIIDNAYHKNLLKGRGLLKVDQGLTSNPSTSHFVEKMAADAAYFRERFAAAILQLSENNPLAAGDGEVRKDCAYVNSG